MTGSVVGRAEEAEEGEGETIAEEVVVVEGDSDSEAIGVESSTGDGETSITLVDASSRARDPSMV